MAKSQLADAALSSHAIQVNAAGKSDVGRQRKLNEDHWLLRPSLDLYVVADGMGGHNAGDIASKLTTTSLKNFYEATQGTELPKPPDSEADLPLEAQRLAAAIRKANQDVWEISSTYQQHHGMGSTVVALALDRHEGRVAVGHVGDSRCYRLRRGDLELLTRDHSLVNDALAMKPDLTEAELARLPKNIITRALGMKSAVQVDIRSEEALPGDTFMLCSDGLSGLVKEAEMQEVLSEHDDLQAAANKLIDMANAAGGNDNITALIIRVDGDPDAVAEATSPAPPSTSQPPMSGPNVSVADEEEGDDLDLPDDLPDDYEGALGTKQAEQLARGEEVQLGEAEDEADGGDDMGLATCRTCSAELYLGCKFCVMCGEPIDPSDGRPEDAV